LRLSGLPAQGVSKVLNSLAKPRLSLAPGIGLADSLSPGTNLVNKGLFIEIKHQKMIFVHVYFQDLKGKPVTCKK